MKHITALIVAVGMLQAAVPSVNAAESEPVSGKQVVLSAFGAGTVPANVDMLDETQMQETRGRLAPLVVAATIAGLDLAMMSFFYGVYVPNYASHGGACATCSGSSINHH